MLITTILKEKEGILMGKRSFDACILHLSKENVRLTAQRQAILRLLKEGNQHFTIDEVHKHMSKKFEGFTLATVYNTLRVLASHGVIRELKIEGQKSRYEGNDADHGHLYCTSCGRIEDVPIQQDSLMTAEIHQKGFALGSFSLVMHGTCEICQLVRKTTA